jgi:regulatory protein
VSEPGREECWAYALRLLTRRSHTEAEIRARLTRKGSKPELVDETVARLAHYGLVDDKAYAEAYVRSRRTRKGSLALRHELRRKGVTEVLSEEALLPLDEASEVESAASLLQRNAWRFRGAEARRNRAKAFAFLARRGFAAEVALGALERLEWQGGEE